mmetsp:Transcript_10790/g.17174  ORF Transcript_10790/g.17174 Transcript_10790/m.17174 type:complete len:200 (-) Transcript_10790:1-600(-)
MSTMEGRRRCRSCRATRAVLVGSVLFVARGSPSFAAVAGRAPAAAATSSSVAVSRRGPRSGVSLSPASSRGRGRVARRIFDSGSFFGIGAPEAVIIALLGWFLLGPEELFKLAKQVGGWLGELRTYIGQAAKQYEGALDDQSTRQAIEGIRKTQRTVSELAGSWRSVADTFRDPLQIGSVFESSMAKLDAPRESKKTRS